MYGGTGNLRSRVKRFERIESIKKIIENRKKETLMVYRARLAREIEKEKSLESRLDKFVVEKASFKRGEKLPASYFLNLNRQMGYLISSLQNQKKVVEEVKVKVEELQKEYMDYRTDRERITFIKENLMRKLREIIVKKEERELEETFRLMSSVLKNLFRR